jgi:hypothetical protein
MINKYDMKKYIYNPVIFLKLILFVPFLISCEDEIPTESIETPDRLFRPVSFTAAIDGNDIKFSWGQPIKNATYLLEVSKDSLLFNNELQVFAFEDMTTYSLGDLWSNTRYSARIKAISKVSEIKDSGYKAITFTTGTENIFYTVDPIDIGSDEVILKWNNSKNVSRIVITTADVDDVIVLLSAEDKSSGQKLIENLSNNTNYTFYIYLGEMLRGTITVKTEES